VPSLLPADEQQQWLRDHIPHRIRAVLPGIPIQNPWLIQWQLAIRAEPHGMHCLQNAIWEGRLTAMRWLIMFVGISEYKGKAVSYSLKHPKTDVRIDRIDNGVLFDHNLPNALKLALLWKGCSQATSHPTQGTSHPPCGNDQLAEGLNIVINHLEQTIYAKNGRSIIKDTLGS
jgi:hypothetical protein